MILFAFFVACVHLKKSTVYIEIIVTGMRVSRAITLTEIYSK